MKSCTFKNIPFRFAKISTLLYSQIPFKKSDPNQIHHFQKMQTFQEHSEDVCKTLETKVYKIFIAQKYSKYKHKYPRWSQSLILEKIKVEWDFMGFEEKNEAYRFYKDVGFLKGEPEQEVKQGRQLEQKGEDQGQREYVDEEGEKGKGGETCGQQNQEQKQKQEQKQNEEEKKSSEQSQNEQDKSDKSNKTIEAVKGDEQSMQNEEEKQMKPEPLPSDEVQKAKQKETQIIAEQNQPNETNSRQNEQPQVEKEQVNCNSQQKYVLKLYQHLHENIGQNSNQPSSNFINQQHQEPLRQESCSKHLQLDQSANVLPWKVSRQGTSLHPVNEEAKIEQQCKIEEESSISASSFSTQKEQQNQFNEKQQRTYNFRKSTLKQKKYRKRLFGRRSAPRKQSQSSKEHSQIDLSIVKRQHNHKQPSLYLQFYKKGFAIVKEENPQLRGKEITKILAAIWQNEKKQLRENEKELDQQQISRIYRMKTAKQKFIQEKKEIMKDKEAILQLWIRLPKQSKLQWSTHITKTAKPFLKPKPKSKQHKISTKTSSVRYSPTASTQHDENSNPNKLQLQTLTISHPSQHPTQK